jgi:hypothetical protein
VFDIDHVMERKTDRQLSQLGMSELMALYFFHAQREEFLRRQLEKFRRIRDGEDS